MNKSVITTLQRLFTELLVAIVERLIRRRKP